MLVEQQKKERIIKYLQENVSQAEFFARLYLYDEYGNKRPERDLFSKLNEYFHDFMTTHSELRWIMLTGLRGSGKTTLLAQLYEAHRKSDAYVLYLSIDQITQILDVNLYEVISVYEDLIGKSIEQLDKPLLLFIDEIQYEKKWGIYLKSIYDRSRKVFVIATGSSALNLNTNADVARRAVFEKLYPLSFLEYAKIRHGKSEKKEITSDIKEILFESSSAEDVYAGLSGIQNDVMSYWIDIEKTEIDRYIRYGSLPFMINLKNEAIVYDQIRKNMDRIINTDVALLGRFSQDVISRIPAILYAIADSDAISFTKLAEKAEISRPKIIDVLDTMERTETLLRIYPYGSHYSQINKPSKYLFSSPAFRSMYFNFIGSAKLREQYMGKLLEDTIGMYLVRYLTQKINTSINYDCAEGGADFIVSFGNEKIVIEAGIGSKGFRQALKSAKKVSPKYSMVVANERLALSEDKSAVRVPLEYFLLM